MRKYNLFNNRPFCLFFLAIFPVNVIASQVIGTEFVISAGSSGGEAVQFVGHKDIDRNVVELTAIKYSVYFYGNTTGFTNEINDLSVDNYRVNCKNKTFAVLSEADVQWKLNAYQSGYRFNYKGNSVNGDKEDSIKVTPEMIKAFVNVCK